MGGLVAGMVALTVLGALVGFWVRGALPCWRCGAEPADRHGGATPVDRMGHGRPPDMPTRGTTSGAGQARARTIDLPEGGRLTLPPGVIFLDEGIMERGLRAP
jgi:hypothetical protein